MLSKESKKPIFWIDPDDVELVGESNMIYVTSSNFDGNTVPVFLSIQEKRDE